MRIHKIGALAGAAMIGIIATSAKAEPQDHTMYVYKTPWCGCCTDWAEHMEGLGYKLEITELEDLAPVRRQAGIPDEVQGCHSAAIAGYALEGHVPPEAIAKLLEEKPDIRGIAVPGMPQGSIGMGNNPRAKYNVHTFGAGTTEGSTVFYQAGR
ncbi:DUF411 domain-containing protein [Acuticoccus sp. MNP-M23]|mgnify:CR=1 FL=1|uniref:DUF411 domain-containing protein n=1 Tax=Acuticoccus sp. MNP-M23 TaxID=3072793 RepID=UPI002814A99C|nr:DUF411 domain-containing protein [Acuticoccus sp. MNP-M23]WMS44394.1 DUF411 domain-containing protein [Acuticoccus sp. MNP-M23]